MPLSEAEHYALYQITKTLNLPARKIGPLQIRNQVKLARRDLTAAMAQHTFGVHRTALKAVLAALNLNRKALCCNSIDELQRYVLAQRQAILDVLPHRSLCRTPWYVANSSKGRRQAAKAARICGYCEENPVTPGFQGKKVRRPYSSCKPCRDKKREGMRELRAARRLKGQ